MTNTTDWQANERLTENYESVARSICTSASTKNNSSQSQRTTTSAAMTMTATTMRQFFSHCCCWCCVDVVSPTAIVLIFILCRRIMCEESVCVCVVDICRDSCTVRCSLSSDPMNGCDGESVGRRHNRIVNMETKYYNRMSLAKLHIPLYCVQSYTHTRAHTRTVKFKLVSL